MIRAVEAIIDEQGHVLLLEDVRLPQARRAIVTILDEPPATLSTTPVPIPDAEPRMHNWTEFYSMVRSLGRGGMGETYLARDRQTGELACIKQLLPTVDTRSLLQECRALARLHHPGIVRLKNFDTTGAEPYLVMEYVDGPSLAHYLRHHRAIAEPLVVSLAIQLFEALTYAHRLDILHCDLKPGNILLEYQGTGLQPKILDFGLAVVDRRDDRDALTAEGRFAGTPSYMAPEQVRGERLSGTSDVYALGQVLWEMLMGRPAFPILGGNAMAMAYEKTSRSSGLLIHEPPLGVSSPLAELIERCTHPDPPRRPSPSEAIDALQTLAIADPTPGVLSPLNLGFDGPIRDGRPLGWFDSVGFVQGVSPTYQFTVEGVTPDRSCVRVEQPAVGGGEFGSLMQRCPARHLEGRAVRLEGRLRSEGVGQRAGFWMRADGIGGTLYFDNMHDRPVRGSTPWTSYALETLLPTGVEWLNYGVLLVGPGRVWCDDLRLLARDAEGSWLPLSLWDADGYAGWMSSSPVNTT